MPRESKRKRGESTNGNNRDPKQIKTNNTTEEVVTTPWEQVDAATAAYVDVLHDFDYKDSIITTIMKTYPPNTRKAIRVLGVPSGSLGSIHKGIDDAVRFIIRNKNTHFASMEQVKSESISPPSDKKIYTITKALSHGDEYDEHNAKLIMRPWRKHLVAAYETPDTKLAIGFLAVDTSYIKEGKKESTYDPHYNAFILELDTGALYLFDSAYQETGTDEFNENGFIIYRVLRHIIADIKHDPSINNAAKERLARLTSLDIKQVKLPYPLQQSAGGGSDDEKSFPAQNVFCHTWCIWFLTMFIYEYHKKISKKGITPKAMKNAVSSSISNVVGMGHYYDTIEHEADCKNLELIKYFAVRLVDKLRLDPPNDTYQNIIYTYHEKIQETEPGFEKVISEYEDLKVPTKIKNNKLAMCQALYIGKDDAVLASCTRPKRFPLEKTVHVPQENRKHLNDLNPRRTKRYSRSS